MSPGLDSITAILPSVPSVDQSRVMPRNFPPASPSSRTIPRVQLFSIAPAVFFSDLEFKRTTDLGVAATEHKAGRLDPVCSATGLQGTAYLSLLGPGML